MNQNKPEAARLFFITGPMRSGTTLLDKVMHSHQSAVCHSQPAPQLYISVKKAFLEAAGIDERYQILSSYFMESRYKPGDFTEFLKTFKLTAAQLDEINEGIVSFAAKNPHYSKADKLALGDDNDLLAIYGQLVVNGSQNQQNAVQVWGSKEIIAEEYLPYFISKGVKCLLIVRDPRDALTSAYYGQGSKYVGKFKPSLLMIRNWRKAVAFALELADEPNILVMRYEDLVSDPDTYLKKITDFVGIPEMDLGQSLDSQNGGQWSGNSSHGDVVGISTNSIGRYKQIMQPEVQRYIESICYPEMAYLGYDNPLAAPDEAIIRSFEAPEPIASMDIKMSAEERHVEAENELQRLSLLSGDACDDDMQQRYFIFPGVYKKLKEARRVPV